jgi:drug/metabolite transporter (DMT)-like permease
MPSKGIPRYLPTLSLLLAATLWGVLWYPVRLLEAHGLAGLWVTLVGYGAILALGVAAWRRRAGELRRRPLRLFALAVAIGWCNVTFILAVLEGTVLRVLLLFYLSPVWAVLFAAILLRERPSTGSLAVVVMAVAGAVIMLWDARMGAPWPLHFTDWLAISSGLTFALSNVLIRSLADISIPGKALVTWVGVVLVAAGWLALRGEGPPVVGSTVWLGAAVLGLIGFFAMTVSVQYGVTHMPIHRSAVILLFELVAGALSAFWLAHEIVTTREWVGGALIVAAAYVSAREQTRAEGAT